MNVKTIALIFFLGCTLSCNEQQSPKDHDSSDTASSAADSAVNTGVADTTNVPRLVSAESDGSYVLTAQKGSGIGPNIKYMPEWRAFGWFTSSDSIQWDVDIKEAGDFNVFLEWSVSDEEAGKEYILRAAKDEITGKVEKSGSWETYKEKNIGDVKLEAGQQTIVFKSKKEFRTDGALLDLRQVRLVKKS
jgi:hypothetical protein